MDIGLVHIKYSTHSEIYRVLRCLKDVYISGGIVEDVSAVVERRAAAPAHVGPRGVCCVVISDPKEIADLLQHEIDNLLLVRGLGKRGEMTKPSFRVIRNIGR